VVEWLDKMKYYDLPVDKHPLGTGVREKTNHYVTGRDGGRDIDLRKFALEGMQLYGKFESLDGEVAHFGAGLKGYLDEADAVSESIKDSIDKFIAANGIEAPTEARYVPVWQPPSDTARALDLRAPAFGSGVVHRLPYRFQLDQRTHLRRPWLSRS
jgi:putative flavoprotein involved in K+ transport